MTTKKTAAPKEKRSPAQCIFDLYNLRFGMTKEEVSRVLAFSEEGIVGKDTLLKAGATEIEMLFDHLDRLWQVRANYIISGIAEAEALLERMSKDYRFHTSTSRVAFELNEDNPDANTLNVRYTEINLKRVYLHHMMALGAAKIAEEEEREKLVKEKEEEEYIPTGPLIF